MWIAKIELFNFKIYQHQTFEFPQPKAGRNIVLIGGMNGYGKTSVLEALYLGLYGKEAVEHLGRAGLKDGCVRGSQARTAIQAGEIPRQIIAVSRSHQHQDAALQIRLELVLDKLRQTRPGVRFDLGKERFQIFLHDPIERRFLRPVPIVGEPCTRLHGLQRRRHDARLPAARSYVTGATCAVSDLCAREA